MAERFSPRIRFNWGFWDGMNRHKWGQPYLFSHFDKSYLAGVQAGMNETGDPQTSDAAWCEHQEVKAKRKANPFGSRLYA